MNGQLQMDSTEGVIEATIGPYLKENIFTSLENMLKHFHLNKSMTDWLYGLNMPAPSVLAYDHAQAVKFFCCRCNFLHPNRCKKLFSESERCHSNVACTQ